VCNTASHGGEHFHEDSFMCEGDMLCQNIGRPPIHQLPPPRGNYNTTHFSNRCIINDIKDMPNQPIIYNSKHRNPKFYPKQKE
jgi:hypothetical protein